MHDEIFPSISTNRITIIEFSVGSFDLSFSRVGNSTKAHYSGKRAICVYSRHAFIRDVLIGTIFVCVRLGHNMNFMIQGDAPKI